MKQLNYLFAFMLALLCGVNTATADVVENYKVDFSKFINVGAHNFKVSSSWGHIVGTYEADGTTYYPTWEYNNYSGNGGAAGCLGCNDQTQLGPYNKRGASFDVLVTPKVKGKVELYTQKRGYNAPALKFYKIIESNGTFTVGDEITPIVAPTLSSYYSYEKVEIANLEDWERIGIYVTNVNIDDFTADFADITKEAQLYVKTVTLNGSTSPYCKEDGKFDVNFNVELQNTGDLDLTPGTDNYSLTLVNETANASLFTVPITEALTVGETKTVSVTGEVDGNLYPDNNKYSIRENIGNGLTYATWIDPIEYLPIMQVRRLGVLKDSGMTLEFNKINKKTSHDINIKNAGGAPMKNITITAPEHFSVSAPDPFTLTAGKDTVVYISALPDVIGEHSGTVTIKAEGVNDFEVGVSSYVLDSNKFYANFEDKKLPAGSYAEEGWVVEARDYAGSDNQYLLNNTKTGADQKFVTPLLKVTEGEAITFDVGKSSQYSTGDDAKLNIYYSADRKNWIHVRKINAEELSSERANTYSYYFTKLTTFTIDNIPAGNWYLAFGAGYTILDNIYGYEPVDVAHDMMCKGFEIAQTGSVNHVIEGKANFTNLNRKPEAAGSYTAKLYFDDKVMAVAEAKEISAATDTTFVFNVMPHEVGTFNAYVVYENATDELKIVSDSVEVTISEEVFKSTLTIGAGDGKTSSDGIYWDYADNGNGAYCDAIYPASMLAKYGLTSGSKVKSISLTGYYSSSTKTLNNVNCNAKIGFVPDGTTLSDPCDPNATGLTNVVAYENASVAFTQYGTVTTTFELAEPIVWDGTSALRFQTYVKGSSYATVYFYVDAEEKHSYHKAYSLPTYTNGNPLIDVALIAEPATLSGTVTCGETPVADATVTLRTSDDVVYSTKSAADGSYSVTVMQPSKEYQLTVTAEGYDDYVATDSYTFEENQTANVELVSKYVTVSGKVSCEDTPVADATVKFATVEGDNVIDYSTVTAQDGTYKIEGMEKGKTYTLTVTATDYKDFTEQGVEVTGNLVKDVTLEKAIATVSGTVTCGETPVVGATVKLATGEGNAAVEHTATTLQDGTYSIAGVLKDLTYTLTVTADGYKPYTEEAVEVTADLTKDVALLKADATVTGKITCNGEPVADAVVSYQYISDDQTVIKEDYTMADGTYSIKGLPVDLDYTVIVSADDYIDLNTTVKVEGDMTKNLEVVYGWVNVSGSVMWGDTPVTDAVVKMTYVTKDQRTLTTELPVDGDAKFTGKAWKNTDINLTVEHAGFELYTKDVALFETDVTKNIKLTALPMEMTVGSTGYATFSSENAISLLYTPEVKAYAVASVTKNYVELTELENYIPANTGVILVAAAGTYQMQPVGDAIAAVEGNMLVATGKTDYTVTSAAVPTTYVLANKDGMAAFLPSQLGDVVPANRAYLKVESTEPIIYLSAATGITAIDAAGSNRLDPNKPAYTISGQRVGKNYKGVVIQNGKTFIIK